MQYTISDSIMPTLEIELKHGETIFTESGGMAWMTPGISMNTNTHGGLLKGLLRTFSDESLFMTTYKCEEETETVTFCNELPGKIVSMDLANNQEIIAQRDAFMCATSGITIEMTFNKKLGSGFFGGEGFFLQKLGGEGTAFLEFCGSMITYELEAGQVLKINPGHIGAFDASVSYDISLVKGVSNLFFGNEGIFLATITGPGRVWLQSMTLANLASRIATKLPKKNRR